MTFMKIVTTRRRQPGLLGVSGVARLDRRTTRLAGRLNPGDIAIIDHVDMDRASAEALVAARPAVVINAQPSVSGRYPNLGPKVVVGAGIPLVDSVGAEIFAAVREGSRIRVLDDTIYLGEDEIGHGVAQTPDTIAVLMKQARSGLATQLEAFAADTSQYLHSERDLLIDGVGIPEVRTKLVHKHVVVVVRGYNHDRELRRLRRYIREFKPVLIGIDGGADALLEAGLKPHMIVGDMDAVSDAALATGAEVVVHAYPDGRAPGMARVQDLGIEPVVFASTGTSEDLAVLLADYGRADLIVTVGTHSTLTEFLDKGRAGMASTFLTRLRVGDKLVDARGVTRIYRSRVSVATLLLLVIAALIAVAATLAATNSGGDYFANLQHTIGHGFNWVGGLFS